MTSAENSLALSPSASIKATSSWWRAASSEILKSGFITKQSISTLFFYIVYGYTKNISVIFCDFQEPFHAWDIFVIHKAHYGNAYRIDCKKAPITYLSLF